MNSYMNISVRVISAAAQAQIKALQAQVARLEGQLARANATSAAPGGIGSARSRKSLMSWGNQIQWTGRQLQYNFTLPLLLAGGAAVKFALDNEKAFTRVQKVYGDTDDAAAQFNRRAGLAAEAQFGMAKANRVFTSELQALEGAFEALSSRYGVAQKEVLETAGAWAAAGVSGRDLAESTELSMKAAILGDFELVKATEALIAIQSQYSLSTSELNYALAQLNSIENQTGISMQGLIDGFTRSAGVAREAGVDVRHLGAMLAALVPASGSAATAGNALKTIISRLMSPTGDAAAVMREFGVDTQDAAWQSSTAVERLTILAGHMGDSLKKSADGGYELSDSQKQVVATVLGSRYQMNRFLVLMREMDSESGYYAKALSATSDRQKVFATATSELNAVLDSNPRKLQIMWVTLQNGMATAIQPLIPYIIYLAQTIAGAVQAFTRLDPELQKFILFALTALAILPLTIRYLGSLITLFGALAIPIIKLVAGYKALTTTTRMVDGALVTTRRTLTGMFIAMLAAPFKAVIAGMVGVAASVWRIGSAFMALPFIASRVAATTGAVATAFAGALSVVPGIVAATGALMLAAWRGIWGAIVLIHMGGTATLVAGWAATISLMTAGTSAFAGIIGIFRGVFAAISVLFSAQMMIPLLLAMGRLGAGMIGVLSSAWATIYITMARGWAGLYVLTASFSGGLFGIWVALYAGITALSAKFYAFLVRIYAIGQAVLITVMATISRGMTVVWAAMHIAMAFVSRTFWSNIIKLWFLAAAALPAALAAARSALVGVWASITALMASGSIASAAAAVAPYALAIAAIIGVLYIFRDQIAAVWNNTVAYFADSSNAMTQAVLRAWNALPQGVANALIAVVTIVRDAAMQIYEWFSYINPFAQHSPSLVDNVTQGMAVVSDQFGKARGAIGKHAKGAYKDIKALGKASNSFKAGDVVVRSSSNKKASKPIANDIPTASKGNLKRLESDLAMLESRMDRQQVVVDRWTNALDRANAALDRQQDKLDSLIEVQEKWQNRLDAAENKLSNFAASPIRGMGEMSDKIFQNEIAQKRLRLEMMKMEDVGDSLDSVKSKIDAINGAQEVLRGEKVGLRAGGAGSEILFQYDEQIAALEKQKRTQEDASSAITDMSTALDELARKGELLDLQNSLKFDPLTRQIEKASDATEELSFDRIMKGIRASNVDIDNYGKKLATATRAVNAQQRVVDRLTAARDRTQDALDREQNKLDQIKDAYDSVQSAISDVETALSDAATAADKLGNKSAGAAAKASKALGGSAAKALSGGIGGGEGAVSPSVQNFRDAAGGNFANVGGAGIPVRTDWSDQTAEIDKFTQQIADEAGRAFGDLNPFGPIKRGWDNFRGWFVNKWESVSSAVKDMFSNIFAGMGGGGFDGAVNKFKEVWAGASGWFKKEIFDPLVSVWRFFWPSIKEFFQNAWEGIKNAFSDIGPEVGGIWEEIKDLGPALKGFWNVLKPILAVVGGLIAILIKLALNVFAKVIEPAIQMVANVFENVLQVFKGAFQIISGFFGMFSGGPDAVTDGLKKMAAGVGNIISGLFGVIGGLFKGAFRIIVGFFWGIIDGIIDAAKWLWNEMVGNSIIPDLINGIIWWFKQLVSIAKWLWSNVITPIFSFFKNMVTGIISVVRVLWAGIKAAWNGLKLAGQWIWNNVLKPVWDRFKSVWNEYIRPFVRLWWASFKIVLGKLKEAGKWVWQNVLKPIWDRFKRVWNDNIRPFIRDWWPNFKRGLRVMWEAAKWIWQNILQPVWNRFKEVWNNYIGPALRDWWSRIKRAWNAIKAAAKWFWDNVLKPVWDRVKTAWERIRDEINKWWGRITSIWSSLKRLGSWFKTNVMDPVFEKIKDVWNNIRDWLNNNRDMLLGPAKGLANGIRIPVNFVIGGLNRVADILPGVSFNIPSIPKFAEGGDIPNRQANRGFKTTGARAIVGEGKANYPEFVIPTDPTYRSRAIGLMMEAGRKLELNTGGDKYDIDRLKRTAGPKTNIAAMAGFTPEYAVGGWLSDRWGDMKGVASSVAKLGKNAAGKIVNPAISRARNELNSLRPQWAPMTGPPKYVLDKVQNWVNSTDNQINAGKKKASSKLGGGPRVRAAQRWARAQAGKPYIWGGVGPGGYDCSGFMSAITNYLRGQNPHSRIGATASFPWGGFAPGYQKAGFTIGSTPQYPGSSVGHMSGTLGGLNVESTDGSVRVGAAARGYNDSGYIHRYHLKMKQGGVALANRGGALAEIGDGRYDEAVVPLPKRWRTDLIGTGSGGNEYHFHGDLSFPNVKDGSDAKSFLNNLESMVKD